MGLGIFAVYSFKGGGWIILWSLGKFWGAGIKYLRWRLIGLGQVCNIKLVNTNRRGAQGPGRGAGHLCTM